MPELGSAAIPARTEIPGFSIIALVHESRSKAVYRARSAAGEEVILKTLRGEYPRKEDAAELRREYRILQRLHVSGVVRARSLVTYGAGNIAIEMDAFGKSLGRILAERARKPLPVDVTLQLIISLARTLGEIHEENLVHKNVVPDNVLVDLATNEVRLIDFAICSELSRERHSAKLSTRLEGSLPYMSPEQTGRTGRDLDYRSDYYTLGVTLYEMLTGTLPFQATDALGWVHRHISQSPPAAHEVNPNVPPALSAIVRKLMAKSPEDRYQSSHGLIADLEPCCGGPAGAGRVDVFDLGTADVSRKFQIPQRLYGREAQIDTLLELFEAVTHGAPQLCLVSGSAGSGKSALVAELGRFIVRDGGHLVEGKFDQFRQSSAYGAFARAFQGLVDELLSQTPEDLERWREDLQVAVGINGRLIVDLVPELGAILGDQPPVAQLPPAEAQNRFQIVFTNFVKVLAARHPLVIFMDDLQWSDVPTLNLLARLATARDMGHLFLIGAYRSSAVDAAHPLAVTLDEIRKMRETPELSLGPLELDAVDSLVADTVHSTGTESRELSRVIHDKAQGNPFFIREILKRLHDNGAFRFDVGRGRWSWDMGAVRTALVGENVLEFMVANLRRLPEQAQEVLQLAACIGNTFDLRTLATIATRTMAGAAADLQEALSRELVVPLTASYRLAGLDRPDEGANATYRFQHDRIQQAAYELIDPVRREGVHLSIGRLMLQHGSVQDIEERLMDIVGHLNAGRDLVTNPHERRELAVLNLRAGLEAVRSSAYASALQFLHIGQKLLGDAPWETDYDLMLAFSREIQQCAYLTSDHAGAESWAETILAYSKTPLARAELFSARTRQYSTMGRMRESMLVAFQGMSLLGVDLIREPSPDDIRKESDEITAMLAGRDVDDLIEAPEVSDTGARVAIRILMEIFPAAFLSGSGNLFPYLVLKSMNLSLRHGNSPESAFTYAAYGMLLCGILNDPALGYKYGRLAVAMNERFNDMALKSRIIYVYAMFIHHWTNHWSSMTPWFLKGIEAGYQSGDLLYLAYSAQDCIIWDPTLDLATASQEQRKYLAIVKDCQYRDSYDSGSLFLQMQLNFQGLTSGQFALDDGSFDEVGCVAGMRERRFMTGIANYHIYKAEIHAFYGDYAGASEHVTIQDTLTASVMSLPQLVRFYVVSFLTRAALYPNTPPAERPAVLRRLHDDLKQMSFWAGNCPGNFEHLRLTMKAELARLGDRLSEAMGWYEAAAAAARSSGFLRDEATANELAGRCLLGHGLAKAAEGYLRAAYLLYDRWGATRKTEQLEQLYGSLIRVGQEGKRSRDSQFASDHANSVDTASLDMESVMKACHSISGELVLDELLKTTLHIMLESAGGQRGFLVVREEGQLVIRAHADITPESKPMELPLPVSAGQAPPLPFTVVNNVLRTNTTVVLTDALHSSRFASDPYIVNARPRSVICVPIQRHGRFSGAVYIENNLSAGAFSSERAETLKLLAVQAGISIENAALYEGQLKLTEAQSRFVPAQFLNSLGRSDIARVRPGEFVARDMSVLFADLRDFTPLVERLGPEAVIALLNRYFSWVSEPITAAGGFIDSFNGDEIMALFPLPADRAVEAAIHMRHALRDLNQESVRTASAPPLEMGIGVNTGPLVLGTVGSQDRLKCGVVGDTVNTAARIEQLTKLYGAPFLIGEQTYSALTNPDRFSIRAIDRVAAKGKLQAITLYEVLDGESAERRAAKESTRDVLNRALQHYFARDFISALSAISEGRAVDPYDRVLLVLGDRAKRYSLEPPPPNWQGFEILTHK